MNGYNEIKLPIAIDPEGLFYVTHSYYQRHWTSAAIALIGLFIFGYFFEALRQLLGSDLLLMIVTLVFLFGLRQLGNYVAGKVSGSQST